MSAELIRQGFETALKAWADAQTPAIPIAWPNVPFNPPAGRYLRSFVLPLPTEYLSLDNVCKRWRGIYQVSFVMPIGTGSGTVESLITSLGAAITSTLTQSGLRIYLLRPFSAAPPISEPDRFVVPVSTAYEAHTTA